MTQSELQAKNMLPVQSIGKRVGACRGWFEFCFSVIEEVERISLTNHRALCTKKQKTNKQTKQMRITFETQL